MKTYTAIKNFTLRGKQIAIGAKLTDEGISPKDIRMLLSVGRILPLSKDESVEPESQSTISTNLTLGNNEQFMFTERMPQHFDTQDSVILVNTVSDEKINRILTKDLKHERHYPTIKKHEDKVSSKPEKRVKDEPKVEEIQVEKQIEPTPKSEEHKEIETKISKSVMKEIPATSVEESTETVVNDEVPSEAVEGVDMQVPEESTEIDDREKVEDSDTLDESEENQEELSRPKRQLRKQRAKKKN